MRLCTTQIRFWRIIQSSAELFWVDLFFPRLLFIHRIWALLVWFRFSLFCQVSLQPAAASQQRECYCFSRCFYRSGFIYRRICICFFTLFSLSLCFFTIHSGRRRKPSHPIEIIPETAGQIKNKSISWAAAAALLEEKEFHGHFTTGSFFYSQVLYK